MDKTKKISINAFDKIIKERYTPTETFEWCGVEITIKKTLLFKEVLEFVDSVVKSCFSKTGDYIPETRDFAIKTCIIEKYTNLTLPNNLEHKYELIYCTDVIEEVLQHINIRQYNEILDAIYSKSAHIAQSNVEAINKQFTEMYSSFADLQGRLEAMFSGVNPGDFTNFLGAFSDGKINEEKIVQAYIESKDGDK